MRKVTIREVLPHIILLLVAIAAVYVFIIKSHPPLSEPWFTDESSEVSESAVSVKQDNIGASDRENVSRVYSANSTFSAASASISSAAQNSEKININSATVSELMTLEGIGEVKAKAIVEYREAHGDFNSVDELTRVSGIGSKTLEKNRDRITV